MTFNQLNERLENLTLAQLAQLIQNDWEHITPSAMTYLNAMRELPVFNEGYYGLVPSDSIVRYFLSNASTWCGYAAQSIKKELNRRIK